MEINSVQTSTQQSASSTEATQQQPVNEQEERASETDLNTESTVTLSTEAQNLSSSTETESSINNEEEAQESVQQFQQDAANDPTVTQDAQSSNLTSKVVGELLG